MEELDITEIRAGIKLMNPNINFDADYSFYYDETNNPGKFYVRESDFNTLFTSNFVLGGIVADKSEEPTDIKKFFDSLRLQSSEVKFKHIAHGNLMECLTSKRLMKCLTFINSSNFYIHFSSLNLLYWALVDIVDSAVANSKPALHLGQWFTDKMKNDLYYIARLEIDSVIKLFYHYSYPNIKSENLSDFINSLVKIFYKYLDDPDYHFGLESLRQVLKESDKIGSLPFIMDEEDHLLIENFSQFYLKPIYLFKNSTHIFDNEFSIDKIIGDFKIMDNSEEIKNFSFVDSHSEPYIQLSDIVVGLLGKLFNYVNIHTESEINKDMKQMTSKQKINLSLINEILEKSLNKNPAFVHRIDSFHEIKKMAIIVNL